MLRGSVAVAAARPAVAAAWDKVAASALSPSPCASSALQSSCERERHEHCHGVRVVLDDFCESGGWRDGLAVFGHAFDVQGERLPCPRERLIEAGRGSDGAGEVWKRDAVIGIGVLADEGDVALAHVLVRLLGDEVTL